MKCNEALRLIQKAGWHIHSQSGSHVKLKDKDYTYSMVFPNHGSKELGKGLQKKLFKQAGITK